MPPAPRYVVCGFPLGQSLSPRLHTWALQRAGLAGTYTARETPPENLAAFMDAVRATPLAGVSLTIPHKERVIPLLDGITETARMAGAVNTLYWEKDALKGHNTDIEGFLAPLAARFAPQALHAGLALVLGAGGAARAVAVGLASLGIPRILISARDKGKAETLARESANNTRHNAFAATDWENRADVWRTASPHAPFLVINTTPVGMRGKAEGLSPYPAESMRQAALNQRPCLAYDLVYNPLQTRFLADAAHTGWTCADGLDMFVTQAAAQFHLWTGREFPLDEARTFLMETLAS